MYLNVWPCQHLISYSPLLELACYLSLVGLSSLSFLILLDFVGYTAKRSERKLMPRNIYTSRCIRIKNPKFSLSRNNSDLFKIRYAIAVVWQPWSKVRKKDSCQLLHYKMLTSSYRFKASNMHPLRKCPWKCIQVESLISVFLRVQTLTLRKDEEKKHLTFSHWGFNLIVMSASSRALLSLSNCSNAAARLLSHNVCTENGSA